MNNGLLVAFSGELVKTKYGPATLEMLETQQMVQEGAPPTEWYKG